PLRWENAYGGARSTENPVGVGFDAKDRRAPNVLSDAGAKVAACFAPIDPRWPSRARRLGDAALDDNPPRLPSAFDFSYFCAAPDDQKVESLRGDETVLLVGLHPMEQEIRCSLPGVRPTASIRVSSARITVPLICDTLSIDGDALLCSLTWRGDVEIAGPMA